VRKQLCITPRAVSSLRQLCDCDKRDQLGSIRVRRAVLQAGLANVDVAFRRVHLPRIARESWRLRRLELLLMPRSALGGLLAAARRTPAARPDKRGSK